MEQISVEIIASMIGNFGFPLVLAIYLLIRFEKKIENLTEAIYELGNLLKK